MLFCSVGQLYKEYFNHTSQVQTNCLRDTGRQALSNTPEPTRILQRLTRRLPKLLAVCDMLSKTWKSYIFSTENGHEADAWKRRHATFHVVEITNSCFLNKTSVAGIISKSFCLEQLVRYDMGDDTSKCEVVSDPWFLGPKFKPPRLGYPAWLQTNNRLASPAAFSFHLCLSRQARLLVTSRVVRITTSGRALLSTKDSWYSRNRAPAIIPL